jgi:hypothetical protein
MQLSQAGTAASPQGLHQAANRLKALLPDRPRAPRPDGRLFPFRNSSSASWLRP